MPSLQEILESDLGLGAQESVKTASEHESEASDNAQIEKLAMELGLADDDSTGADSTSQTQNQNVSGHSKEASMSLDSLYADMFPGDSDVIGGLNEKTASENGGMSKEAAAREERIGRAAFDSFSSCVDAHLDKIAEELAGSATIDMDADPEEEPDQTMASNKPGDSDEPIDTTPMVTDMVTAKNDASTSGAYAQKAPAGMGEQKSEVKQAAVRKHLLLLAMGQ
jgi:hypothetical protein